MEKLKLWTDKTEITVMGPEDTRRLIEVIADKTNDAPIQLPLICLRRAPLGYELLTKGKRPLSFDGMTAEANLQKSQQINAIPISIAYQLDVYTRYYEEADAYMRDILFNLVNTPKFTIEIPYEDIKRKHTANIIIGSTVVDNSAVPERLISGQFTRLTMGFVVDDAYLFDIRTRNNYTLSVDVEVDDNGIDVQTTEETVVTPSKPTPQGDRKSVV